MREIPLHGKYGEGKVALIDDEDYELVSKYRWRATKEGKNFYAVAYKEKINGNTKYVRMHRVIKNAKSDEEVDHKDHNGLNNQKSNLRISTHQQNCANMRKRTKNSQYKGVRYSKPCAKWSARVHYNNKEYYCGLFDAEIEAAKAYDKKALELFGEYACLNFPELDYSNYNPEPYQPTLTSKFRGVCQDHNKNKWQVTIKINRKTIRIGYFDNELDAAKAWNDYIIKNGLNRELNEV